MPNPNMTKIARQLRRNQTPAEKIFWRNVRNRRFMGLKFIRQFVIQHSEVMGKKSYFIPDFYCYQKRLVVEIDGGIHEEQVEYDQLREDILIKMGYRIIRLKNEEVLENWSEVASLLRAFIDEI